MARELILEYIEEQTEKFNFIDYKDLSALILGKRFNLSRNTVSQYLNEFCRDGILFKVNTRPVIFIHKEIFENKYNIRITKKMYTSIDELSEDVGLLEQDSSNEDFNNIFNEVIGVNESLSSSIEQIKMAANYPNGGLPILLTGPTGSGKSFLAEKMYEYCKSENLLQKDAPFIVLNCADFSDNPELLSANLFGYEKGAFTGADFAKRGLLEEADRGILFLDEVHCLKPESQEKLFIFMDKGKYRRIGENDKWRSSKVRLVFATTEDIEKVLLKTFMRRIPITIAIPALDMRTEKEKEHMIISFFQEEAKNIQKHIRVGKKTLDVLQNNKFSGNVGELKNCIKYACANAYSLGKNKDSITIRLLNLPNNAFNSLEYSQIVYDDDEIIDIDKNRVNIENYKNNNAEKLEELYRVIIGNCLELLNQDKEIEDVLKINNKKMYDYYEFILYRKDYKINNKKYEVLYNILDDILTGIFDRGRIQLTSNVKKTLIKYFIEANRYNDLIVVEKIASDKNFKNILNFFKVNYYKEYIAVNEIIESLNSSVDFKLSVLDQIVLIHNVINANSREDNEEILGIIISHGYATATSIADATNKMIGKYVFESIDMPIGSTTLHVIEKLKSYLEKMVTYKRVILLVDMGSLEEIYRGLDIIEDKKVGIVNNITTRLALDIGLKITQKKNMEEILKETSNIVTKYKIIQPKRKKKAIITTCQTGIGTAISFSKLIKESLPENTEIEVKAVDFGTLCIEKETNIYIKDYDVKFIVGTKDPQIDNITFLPIEKIVTAECIKEFKDFLLETIDEDEEENFNNKLIKLFSLENIIQQLTILNGNKLIDYIEDAVKELEAELELKFFNSTKIGLYIHLSCMIERLVIGGGIQSYRDTSDFTKVDKITMVKIKQSLSVVENAFSVDIPKEELGYIFDYIKNDKNYRDKVADLDNN